MAIEARRHAVRVVFAAWATPSDIGEVLRILPLAPQQRNEENVITLVFFDRKTAREAAARINNVFGSKRGGGLCHASLEEGRS